MTWQPNSRNRMNGTSWQRSGAAALAAAAIVASLLGTADSTPSTSADASELAFSKVDFSSSCWGDNCGDMVTGLDEIALEPALTEEPVLTDFYDMSAPTLDPIAVEPEDTTAPVIQVVAPSGFSTKLSEVNTMAAAFASVGWTGAGIDVAVIDSGISPVHGLDQFGQILYGPDLSRDYGSSNENLDLYGHGSHIAGIIAGRADDMTGGAPDARLVSVKVASADGATSVPQIIAAIDWVIQNRNVNGLNIRVLNLSFGLDREGDSGTDPLMAAVDRAWDAGIVVVVAAGNRGSAYGAVDSPAAATQVIAVGSTTAGYGGGLASERVSTWSNSGDNVRNPDLVVPESRCLGWSRVNARYDLPRRSLG
ncbi:MAG: S8 family serine peptidase [Acidimicrobiales bacterium]